MNKMSIFLSIIVMVFLAMVILFWKTIAWAIRHPRFAWCWFRHRQPFSAIHKCALLLVLLLPMASPAQDSTNGITPPPASLLKSGLQVFLDHSTNVEAAVYGDYFLNNHKVGAGFLAMYKLNGLLAIGAGADWAGEWRAVSGNVSINHTFTLTDKFSLNTYAIAGALTSIGGAGSDNGALATVEGGGAQLHYQINDKWNLGLGAAYIQRQNCGTYSGGSIPVVLTLNFGF